jgi:hypothetical protein
MRRGRSSSVTCPRPLSIKPSRSSARMAFVMVGLLDPEHFGQLFPGDGGGWWADGLDAPRAATWCVELVGRALYYLRREHFASTAPSIARRRSYYRCNTNASSMAQPVILLTHMRPDQSAFAGYGRLQRYGAAIALYFFNRRPLCVAPYRFGQCLTAPRSCPGISH